MRTHRAYTEYLTAPAPKPKNRVLYAWRGWGWAFYRKLKQGKPKAIKGVIHV